MTAPETVVVSLPYGLSAVYVMRPKKPAPPVEHVMRASEHKAAVQQALDNSIGRRPKEGCPF